MLFKDSIRRPTDHFGPLPTMDLPTTQEERISVSLTKLAFGS